MTARTVPPGRMIISRAVLASLEAGGYAGEISVWSCKYECEIHRAAGGVEVVLWQPAGGVVPADGYRQPAIDGEAA
jgi:hypothetical protein